jgi:hypothetical protein
MSVSLNQLLTTRKKLEDELLTALQKFEGEFLCSVREIELDKMSSVKGLDTVANVTLHINLPPGPRKELAT